MTTYYKYTETNHGTKFQFDASEALPAFIGATSLKANPPETVPGPPADPDAGTVIRTSVVARSPRTNVTDPVSQVQINDQGIILTALATGADDIVSAPGTSVWIAPDSITLDAPSDGTHLAGQVSLLPNQAAITGQSVNVTAVDSAQLFIQGGADALKVSAAGTEITGSASVSADLNVLNGTTTVKNLAVTGTVTGISGGSASPTGAVTAFAGSSAPSGWALCDGSSVLRTGTYAALFAVIGTTYGSVDGTHFTLPDLRANIPVGFKASDPNFGTLGGAAGATSNSHTHTSAAHTHTSAAHSHSMSSAYTQFALAIGPPTALIMNRITTPAWNSTVELTGTGSNATPATGNTVGAAIGGTTDSTTPGATGSTTPGATGSSSVSTLQPSVTMNYIIKL